MPPNSRILHSNWFHCVTHRTFIVLKKVKTNSWILIQIPIRQNPIITFPEAVTPKSFTKIHGQLFEWSCWHRHKHNLLREAVTHIEKRLAKIVNLSVRAWSSASNVPRSSSKSSLQPNRRLQQQRFNGFIRDNPGKPKPELLGTLTHYTAVIVLKFPADTPNFPSPPFQSTPRVV